MFECVASLCQRMSDKKRKELFLGDVKLVPALFTHEFVKNVTRTVEEEIKKQF